MELLDNLGLGLGTALQPQNVLYCLIGVVLGTAVGVLPGIGPTANPKSGAATRGPSAISSASYGRDDSRCTAALAWPGAA